VVSGRLFTASFDGRIIVWDCADVQKNVNSTNLTEGTTANDQSRAATRSNSDAYVAEGNNLKSNNSSFRLGKQQDQPQDQLKTTYIGPSLLNHTLQLFAKPHHTREELYPELVKSKKTRAASIQSAKENALVSGLISKAISRKNRGLMGSMRRGSQAGQQQSRTGKSVTRNDSSSSTSSEDKKRGCFSRFERLIHSSSSSTRSNKQANQPKVWPISEQMASKSGKSKCKGHKVKTKKIRRNRETRHDAVNRSRARMGNHESGETLNQSIRALIQSADEYEDDEGDDEQGGGGVGVGDSANVRRAIDALEPYLRSFK